MKFKFDSNQQYQLDAIKAVCTLFEGQPSEEAISEYQLKQKGEFDYNNGVGNNLVLSMDQIQTNLRNIQKHNEIENPEAFAGMNFSVEMETGTGKTYVYLRTIYELNQLYGFKKFVIVVPSVAIREGVLKSLEITHDHFQNLYNNEQLHFQVYDSSRVSSIRGFASANNIEVLVINIDSFAKDENIINKPNDKLNGEKPIDFIRGTSPIVIVDEPQNMETEKRKQAIEGLNPLCTLRYSATHKHVYNLVYSLNPVKAYDLGLVKQIEVDSVIEENAYNDAFISLNDVKATKTKVTAKVSIDVNDPAGVKRKPVSVKVGDDLYKISNQREIYKDGFLIEEIDANDESISLSSGAIIRKGQSQGGLTDEVMKFQVQRTIEEHLKKELKYKKKGIKVLSLFFVDRVANYRQYDEQGNPLPGKFARWFEEIYKDFISKPAFKDLDRFDLSEIHNGYFSQDNKGKIKDTSGITKADDSTYQLIMKDKEKLLDMDNPLRFIFSHSALREGWDNPNVFQICTLNETKSDMKKRQEIGRGLRLAVNQTGQRSFDRNINRLTVIANEAYEDFAKTLQHEIEEDCGVNFKGRIKNARTREKIRYRKGFEADPAFLAIWEKIKHKTVYQVDYDTNELIVLASRAIKNIPEIKAPSIRSTKVRIGMTDNGLDTSYVSEKKESYGNYPWKIPDILGYIQIHTELTRHTIRAILKQSERLNDVLINPQLFLDYCIKAIKETLQELMIDGIKYRRIGSSEYEMSLFHQNELEIYLDNHTFNVSTPEKTIYENYIPLDSEVESQFAKDCETADNIQFYFKLPAWFKILTPIGNYNPDWAVVFEGEKKIYFIAETKDTGTPEVDKKKLHLSEQLKIKCGESHFRELDGLEYRVVNKISQLVE